MAKTQDTTAEATPEPTVAEADATAEDLVEGELYVGKVTGTESYGVFVALTPHNGSDLCGLIHSSRLPALSKAREFEVGEMIVVEFCEINDDGNVDLKAKYSESSGSATGPIPDVDPTDPSRVTKYSTSDDEPGADETNEGDGSTFARAEQVDRVTDRLDAVSAAISRIHGQITSDSDRPFAVQNAVDTIVDLHDRGFEISSVSTDLGDRPRVVVEFDEQQIQPTDTEHEDNDTE